MTRRLFVDTSAWLALVNRKDPEHRSTKKLLDEYAGQLVTSNYVFDETVTHCRLRLGHTAAVRVGVSLRDPAVVHLDRASAADERHAWELLQSRSDKTYSFTDCICFVTMKRLNLTRAAALDHDFRREGFEVLP